MGARFATGRNRYYRWVPAGLGSAAVLVAVSCSGGPRGATGSTSPSPSSSSSAGVRAIAVTVGTPPLTATLTLPSGAGRAPAVVLVGGSGPNDQDESIGPDKPFLDLANGLAARGIASLRYDKRTKDYPAGVDVATFTPTEEYVPDALAAVAVLRSRPEIDGARIFLLGHSQGGTFAPKIATADPTLAGVILAAAGAEPFGKTLVRQFTYLATLPGSIGAQAAAKLPEARRDEAEIESPTLATESPTTVLTGLLGGVGPRYYLDLGSYDEVATARSLMQPILLLQGERDYNVTVSDDLNVWLNGLPAAKVTVHRYPAADHFFIDGTGPPSPADYEVPGHVDPQVIADIASWIDTIR